MRKLSDDQLKEVVGKEVGLLPSPSAGEENLSPALHSVFVALQRSLSQLNEEERLSSEVIERCLQTVSEDLGFELSPFERDLVLSQVERDSKPFGILQPLIEDDSISDIIIHDFAAISYQKGRRTFRSQKRFSSQQAYESFVERLLQRAGSTCSTKKPVADGMIGSFARIHVVHKALCETGPYLTIRMNRFSSITLEQLEESGLAPAPILRYLAKLVSAGHTLLIVGEVGTGKTTLARAMAGAFAPEESVLVIEDTPEIRLEHPQTRYVRTREANMDGAGRIAPAECIRAGMRMAMNRIVFGEIRDAEAAEAFIDVCSSGHPGLSTIHAKSAVEALSRLELFLGRAQRGVQNDVLLRQISTAVQVVVHLDICQATGRRRITEVREIGAAVDGSLRQRELFRYSAANGQPRWKITNRVSSYRSNLEQGDAPIVLSKLPVELQLSPEVSFREGLAA